MYSCKYSVGTRDDVQMFRVPNDPLKLKQWRDSIGLLENVTLQGFVCIEHFEKDQLTNGKYRRLKLCAAPTIFNGIWGKNNEQTKADNIEAEQNAEQNAKKHSKD